MKRSTRKSVAAETVRIIDSGTYESPGGRTVDLREAIARCQTGPVCHLPGERDGLVRANAPASGGPARVSVANQTSLEGARDLLGEGAEQVACLNFASAKNPGGGFLGGSEAQEEALCRPSALYASLLTAQDTYYETNRRGPDALYTDHIIYSPDVPVFRDDTGELLEEPYHVSVVTAPAPNRGAVEHNSPDLVAEIESVFRRRIEHVLAVMACHSHRNNILGPLERSPERCAVPSGAETRSRRSGSPGSPNGQRRWEPCISWRKHSQVGIPSASGSAGPPCSCSETSSF